MVGMPEGGSYKNRLANTRSLIQREKLSVEKHYIAENFRQEVAWSNALLVYEIKKNIPLHHEKIKGGELKTALLSLGLPVKEDTVNSFVEAVIEQQKKIKYKEKKMMLRYLGTDDIAKVKKDDEYILGKAFFKEITGKEPKGNVKYLFSDFAIAIEVVEDEDFLMLDQRKSVVGFYNHRFAGRKDWVSYPYFAINGGETIFDHEQGHAIDRIIMETLNSMGISGKFDSRNYTTLPPQMIKSITKQLFLNQSQEERNQKLVNLFRKYLFKNVFSGVKDEFLADIQRDSGDLSLFDERLDKLCNQKSSYNYFEENFILKFLMSNKDKKIIWDAYTNDLRRFVKPVQEFVALTYKTPYPYWKYRFLGHIFSGKNRLFPYLLAQYSIEEWSTALQSYLLARKNVFSALQELENKVGKLNNSKWEKEGLPEEERIIRRKKITDEIMRKKLESQLTELQNQSENALADKIREVTKKYHG